MEFEEREGLKANSPDGKYQASIFWSNSHLKHISISISSLRNQEPFEFVHQIPTIITVTFLEGSMKWEQDGISIQADDGVYEIKRPEGTDFVIQKRLP